MVQYTVVRTVGSKFGVRIERMEGFILGIQAAFRKRGGVRLSLFGWSLWVGMIPIREIKRGDVAGGDPLDALLAEQGRKMEVVTSIEYDFNK